MTVARKRFILVLSLGLGLGLVGLIVVAVASVVSNNTRPDWNTPPRVVNTPPPRPRPAKASANLTTAGSAGGVMTRQIADAFANQLSSGSPSIRASGIKGLDQLFTVTPESVAPHLASLWLDPLVQNGYHEEIARWALAATVCTPAKPLDMATMEKLLEARSRALLANGQPDAALGAAKSYYNFVRFKQSTAAEDLIVECLKADPSRANLIDTFVTEQIKGKAASTQPVVCTVLKGIKVESQSYDDAVARIEKTANEKSGFEYYHSLLQRGNRLLMADKPAEAKKFFQEAYEFSSGGFPRWFSASQVRACAESVARANRAEDGTPARALHYLTTVPNPAAATRATTK